MVASESSKPILEITVYTLASYTLAYTLDYTLILESLHEKSPLLLFLLLARMATPMLGALAALAAAGRLTSIREALERELLVRPPRRGEWDKALFTPVILVLSGYTLPTLLLALLGYRPCPALEAMGPLGLALLTALLIVAGVLAAVTVNLLAALLEEAGWRGLLYTRLRALGLGPHSSGLLAGLAWGLWHAPLVYQGYNYNINVPGCSMQGPTGLEAVAVFTLYTMGLGLLLSLAVERYGSVIPAAAGHGAANALGGLFARLAMAPTLLGAPAGLAVAAGMAIVALAWSRVQAGYEAW